MTHDPLCPDGLSIEHCCDVVAEIRADERAAALRDAVEAVKSLPVVLYDENLGLGGDWNPSYRYGVRLTGAVAAIEALGKEKP